MIGFFRDMIKCAKDAWEWAKRAVGVSDSGSGQRRRRYISGPGHLKHAVADKLVRFARGRQHRSGGGKKPPGAAIRSRSNGILSQTRRSALRFCRQFSRY